MSPSVRNSLSVLVLGAALAACSPSADAPSENETTTPAVSSQTTGPAALAVLGLDEQGQASWDSYTQDGDAYVFTNFKVADEEGALVADQLIVEGLGQADDGPILERFELINASLVEAESPVEIGFERMAVREAGPDLVEQIAALIQGREAVRLDGDLTASRFGEVSLTGLTSSGTDELGQRFEFAMAQFIAQSNDGETLARAALTGLSFSGADETGAPVSGSLGELSFEGVVSALLAGLSADGGANAAAPLENFTMPVGQYERFDMRDLLVSVNGLRIEMPSFSGVVEPASNGDFIATSEMERALIAPDSDSPAGAQVAGALSMLGYDGLEFSMTSRSRYDAANDRMSTEGDNVLRLVDGFALSFEQSYSGIQAYNTAYTSWLANGGSLSEQVPDDVLALMQLERFAMRLDDESLLDRALTMAAAQQGLTPEQVRANAGAYVAMGSLLLGDFLPPELSGQLQSSLTGFISQGGALTVEVAPETPVGMDQLMGEGAFNDFTALGLVIGHDAPE